MNARQAITLVARREIVERVRDRSFVISILVFLGLIAAFVFVPRFLGFGTPDTYRLGWVGEEAEAMAATAAQAADDDIEIELVAFDDSAAAEAAVADGEITAALDGREVVVRTALPGSLRTSLQQAAAQLQVYEGFAERGVDAGEVDALLTPPDLAVRALEPGADPDAADTAAAFAVVVVLVLYGQLLGYGIGVASGIVEEKQTRVVEVLLSTMRPSHLLAGKVLGIGVVGLAQLALQAAAGLALVIVAGVFELPPGAVGALAWTLFWYVLGYAFYASAFAIVGAISARQEDLQNAATPLSLLILGALFVSFGANANPTSTLARVGALLPPTSPMVMPIRLIRGVAEPWEVAVAVALLLVAIVGIIALAGRVYRGGALQVASRIKLRQALRSS